MGTIVPRKRKDGSTGYTAQIVIKDKGQTVHREAKTFEGKKEAKAWLGWRETELKKPGVIEKAKPKRDTLADLIDMYTEAKSEIGKTKTQVLRTIKDYPIASIQCSRIRSKDISDFAASLLEGGRKPQTVGNYISHLSGVFSVAKPLWGVDVDMAEMRAAQSALARIGTISASTKREQRPTLEQLDSILSFFQERSERSPKSAPMVKIILFALFSTRRQEEITRIKWSDLDEQHSRVLVRDMKHPGQKKGNDVWCELPPEALQIALSMPKIADEIFPYGTDAISASWTRACKLLDIRDIRFHDLRHEGVSRLFEMGRTIPLAASVSGHRSWSSLQRYAQIRSSGDKFENWKWLAET